MVLLFTDILIFIVEQVHLMQFEFFGVLQLKHLEHFVQVHGIGSGLGSGKGSGSGEGVLEQSP